MFIFNMVCLFPFVVLFKKLGGMSTCFFLLDFESNGTSIFCRVFFMEQFDSLRRRCGLAHQDGFIESLARCIDWESSGGKSRSSFLKTKGEFFSCVSPVP